MPREVFLLCESRETGKRFEIKFVVKDEIEEDCLVQDLEHEHTILDVCHNEKDKPIEKYSKLWGRISTYNNIWKRINGKYKKKTTAQFYD